MNTKTRKRTPIITGIHLINKYRIDYSQSTLPTLTANSVKNVTRRDDRKAASQRQPSSKFSPSLTR